MEESRRLALLRDYQILDSPRSSSFDGITSLAAKLLKVPIAAVTFIDENRIWIKSSVGTDLREISNESGLCKTAYEAEALYEIEDTAQDPRTQDNSLVKGKMGIRFYAGWPLTGKEGAKLGTLCVMDTQPRKLSPKEKEILAELGKMVVVQLEQTLTVNYALGGERRSSDNLKAILDTTPDDIVLLDKDFKVLLINDAARKNLQSSTKGGIEIGSDLLQLFAGDDRQVLKSLFQRALQGEKVEIEHKSKASNRKRWYKYKVDPVYHSSNSLLGIVFSSTDIHQRKLVELSLLQSEEKFRKVIESAANPIIIVDHAMKITLVNPEVEKVFGFAPEELIGNRMDILIPDRFRERHRDLQNDYAAKPKPIRMGLNRHTPALKKNGQEIIIEASLNSFELDDQRFFLVIIQDVTARMESEKRIKSQLEKLSAIAWHQSHDVRQPLANVLGFVDLIKSERASGYNEEYLDLLEQSAKELDQVIHKIVRHTSDKQ